MARTAQELLDAHDLYQTMLNEHGVGSADRLSGSAFAAELQKRCSSAKCTAEQCVSAWKIVLYVGSTLAEDDKEHKVLRAELRALEIETREANAEWQRVRQPNEIFRDDEVRKIRILEIQERTDELARELCESVDARARLEHEEQQSCRR